MSVIVNYTDCQRKEREFIPCRFHPFFFFYCFTPEWSQVEFCSFFFVQCDICGMEPIQGVRWHCQDCPPDNSVDFCSNCSNMWELPHLSSYEKVPETELVNGMRSHVVVVSAQSEGFVVFLVECKQCILTRQRTNLTFVLSLGNWWNNESCKHYMSVMFNTQTGGSSCHRAGYPTDLAKCSESLYFALDKKILLQAWL